MSEQCLVTYGAPTLAGIKTGSLFSDVCDSSENMLQFVRSVNHRLAGKGVRLILLRTMKERVLLYLYRPALLQQDLAQQKVQAMLHDLGYTTDNANACVADLGKRLRTQQDFPHEIGLFLGYPVEDVQGFMKDSASGYKCVGCWKVYGDETSARKRFDQYKACTRIFCEQLANGTDIEKLTVAC